ncbi:MAG: transposase [Saprospiraceae bacterium]
MKYNLIPTLQWASISLFMIPEGMALSKNITTKLYRKDWVVYCHPPYGSKDTVLKYLARYTH